MDTAAWLDILYLVLAILFLLVGLVGCILPVIPGPPIAYLGLLIMQLREEPPFGLTMLLIWGAIVVLVTVLDYAVPAMGTKRYGGTNYGVWGSMIGLLLGIIFPVLGPFTIIVAPFAGAFVGEMIKLNDSEKALKAAWGSFLGFLAGTVLKIVVVLLMSFYLLWGLIF